METNTFEIQIINQYKNRDNKKKVTSMCASSLSGALVDIYGDYKYMYYACGVFMLVPGIYFFIMHYYNYKKLDEELRQDVAAELRTCEEAVQLKMIRDGETKHETDG